MKVTFAIAALLGLSEAVQVERHHKRSQYAYFDRHHRLVQMRSYPGVTLMQTEVDIESDPIHGSLGPPARAPYEPNEEQKLEADLRSRKPRPEPEYEDETVKTTENSLNIAEKITNTKMEEPFDVIKAEAKFLKANPIVHYKVEDSSDEDEETRATR